MTDDEGAGEGPYTLGLSGNAYIINKKSGCAYMGLEMRSLNAVCSWMNEAYDLGREVERATANAIYAEGRKAERDRCLAIINQCRPRTDHGWLKFCEEIEKGCQDGK